MIYLPNGMVAFNSIPDMYYDLFMEIGLGINPSTHYLYDQDNDMPIAINEKFIKASITGEPLYPGRNDIVFDPANDYNMIRKLFGYYLDKAQNSEDGDLLCGYIADFIDDNETKDKQRVVVRTQGRGDISSAYYFNIYLAFIDCIFRIAGYNPDLSAFDIPRES